MRSLRPDLVRHVAVALLVLVRGVQVVFGQAMPVEVRNEALESVVMIAPYDWEAGQFLGSLGSGTIISSLGHVLTNHHVIAGPDGVALDVLPIFTSDAKALTAEPQLTYLAVLVEADPSLDLALLQITADWQGSALPIGHTFPFAPVGTVEGLFLGDPVFVIGYPAVGGNTITLTGGVASGFVGEDLVSGGDAWVKTDARIAPGNSGGGAFDAAGALIGVPTVLRTSSVAGVNQEFFRPVNYAYGLFNRHVPVASIQVGPRSNPQATPAAPPLTPPTASTFGGTLGLGDGRYFENRVAHAYSMTVGEPGRVNVVLESSDFDPYLLVLAPDGTRILEVDDSANAGVNVSEQLRVPAAGRYTVIVTTAFAWDSGAYRLGLVPADGLVDLRIEIANVPGGGAGSRVPSYSGTWSGRIVDSAGGRGAVIAILTQTGNAAVDGTWEAAFEWGKTSGTLVGLIQSEGLFVELYPSDPTACPFSGLAELAGYTIAGTYTAFNCTIPIAGSISLTKRP